MMPTVTNARLEQLNRLMKEERTREIERRNKKYIASGKLFEKLVADGTFSQDYVRLQAHQKLSGNDLKLVLKMLDVQDCHKAHKNTIIHDSDILENAVHFMNRLCSNQYFSYS